MDILFVATELAPYVQAGGSAHVVAALGKTLRQLGHKVTLAMPRFPGIERGGLLVARRLTPLSFEFGGSTVEMTVYDGRLASGIELVLLDAPGLFFDREGIYGEPGGGDYDDNLFRFGVFSKAVAELVRHRARLGTPFDLVHAHDWATALVPVHLRGVARETGLAIPTVLTISDPSSQGLFPAKRLPQLGLPAEEAAWLKQGNQISFLQGGVRAAERVVVPSRSLFLDADEVGAGLAKALAAREDELVEIPQGIDYAIWNPATDAALAARYDAEDASNKERCKTALLRELNLPIDEARPLVVHLGMSQDEGTDLVSAAMGRIVRAGAIVVVAGQGDPKLAATVQRSASRVGGEAAVVTEPTDSMVHRVLSAADIVLVPARKAVSENAHLRAQRYGALPVVSAVLRDAVVDCDAALETGTGIVFEKTTAPGLVGATQRAIAAHAHERFPLLRRRIMKLDLGWDRPARRHEQLYRTLLTGKPVHR